MKMYSDYKTFNNELFKKKLERVEITIPPMIIHTFKTS